MLFSNVLYSDRDNETRSCSRRFLQQIGKMPNMASAGVYTDEAYLQGIAATGTETSAVMAKNEAHSYQAIVLARDGRVRVEERLMHDMESSVGRGRSADPESRLRRSTHQQPRDRPLVSALHARGTQRRS